MFINGDLIGQEEDIELFNNIGCLDDLEGRLTAWLTLQRTPRLTWEFETARGNYTEYLKSINNRPQKLSSWEGSDPCLLVENPTLKSWGGHRRQFSGYAEQVLWGNIDADAHYFDFYIPNTDFIRAATGGSLEDTTRALNNEPFKVDIGTDWSIEIFTNQKSLNWLDPKTQNRGSMITLKIRLNQTQQVFTNINNLAVKSLNDAKKIISDLCLMLSFANGGYTKPIYGLAKKIANVSTNQIINVASFAQAPLISPQEEIGIGFIRDWGIKDLLEFIKCFPNFQKMLKTNHWHEKWIIVLEWYFQAIPRLSGRRQNALLPVVANALGALLENFAFLILVEDEPDLIKKEEFNKTKGLRDQGFSGVAHYHIDTVLKRIGISTEKDIAKNFVEIRNNSTHPKKRPTPLNEMEQWEVIYKALQWVDEIILWRLGYTGQYRERRLKGGLIQPRYDLSLRDPNW
jgi:hypothetical protein